MTKFPFSPMVRVALVGLTLLVFSATAHAANFVYNGSGDFSEVAKWSIRQADQTLIAAGSLPAPSDSIEITEHSTLSVADSLHQSTIIMDALSELSSSSDITADTLNVTDAEISSTSLTVTHQLMVNTDHQSRVASGLYLYDSTLTLQAGATATIYSGGLVLDGAATIINQGTLTLLDTTSIGTLGLEGISTINNYNLITSSGTASINPPPDSSLLQLNNAGTIQASSGTLTLTNLLWSTSTGSSILDASTAGAVIKILGPFNVAANETVTVEGPGTVDFLGAVMTVNGKLNRGPTSRILEPGQSGLAGGERTIVIGTGIPRISGQGNRGSALFSNQQHNAGNLNNNSSISTGETPGNSMEKMDPTRYQWLTPEQTLLKAAKAGDLPIVNKMLDQGVDINVNGGPSFEFPLYAAINNNQVETVKLLLARGADVHKKTYWGDPAFNRACWLRHKVIADLLLQAGADRDDLIYYAGTGDVPGLISLDAKKPITDPYVWAALSFAVASGNITTTDWLLAKLGQLDDKKKQDLFNYLYDTTGRGGDVDMLRHLEDLNPSPDLDKKALDSAIYWNRVKMVNYLLGKPGGHFLPETQDASLLFEVGDPEVTELLIAWGQDTNAQHDTGETVLMRASAWAWSPSETIRVLLRHGANPNAADHSGTTALMRAHDGATVEVLLQYGADLSAKNKEGVGVLEAASDSRDNGRLDAVIRHGAPFDPKTDGPTILLHAARTGQLNLMTYLLDHNVDPNEKGQWDRGSNSYMQPLQAAVSTGQDAAAKLLLDRGAKPDENMMVPALSSGRTSIVKLLWDHGVRKISPLSYAVSQDASVDELQRLLDQGSPVDPPEDRTLSPLGVAAGLGNLAAVEFLVEHKATINGENPGNAMTSHYRNSPLCKAASAGRDEVIDYLLKHGAVPDGETMDCAFDYSTPKADQNSRENLENTVRILINADALKGLSDQDSARLLERAIFRGAGGDPVAVKMLLDAGLSLEARGNSGQTVMQRVYEISQQNGRAVSKEMLSFLKQADQNKPAQ